MSAIRLIKEGFASSAYPIVIRLVRGILNLKHVQSQYCETVNKVLLYLRTLSPITKLPLEMLTPKLAILFALTLASKTQSIHLLSISNMQNDRTYTFHYSDVLKQTRPGKRTPFASLKTYPVD